MILKETMRIFFFSVMRSTEVEYYEIYIYTLAKLSENVKP